MAWLKCMNSINFILTGKFKSSFSGDEIKIVVSDPIFLPENTGKT